MGNILTLAQKELRAYFVSPIAYVLLVFFALLFGYFYASSINFMVQLSMGQFGTGGPQIININEFMIRPLFGNTAVILLFMLPMLTMRSFAEEKRSGTIELLLTSPLTDFQIIMGKFLGAMALYTLKCITAPRLPNNDGATVPISISAPVGCLLNAVPPAPSAGRHVIGHFIPPLIFGALAEVVPDRVMAGSGLIDFITLQGRRPDGSGMSTTFCAAGGFGALSDLDGQPTTPGSSNMGGMSAELFEPESGLVVERKSLRPDSGGAEESRLRLIKVHVHDH